MPRWIVPVLIGVGIGLIVLFAVGIGGPWGGGDDPEDRNHAAEAWVPPTVEELEQRFKGHLDAFEKARDILIAAPHQPFSMQVDFLWWKKWDGWLGWTLQDGRWWSPDQEGGLGVFEETGEMLRDAGLDAEDFGFLRSFLHAEGLFSMHRVSDGGDPAPVILFRAPHPDLAAEVERSIAWHADPDPFTSEGTYVYSDTKRVPQVTTETSLGVPGWFVRTITRERLDDLR